MCTGASSCKFLFLKIVLLTFCVFSLYQPRRLPRKPFWAYLRCEIFFVSNTHIPMHARLHTHAYTCTHSIIYMQYAHTLTQAEPMFQSTRTLARTRAVMHMRALTYRFSSFFWEAFFVNCILFSGVFFSSYSRMIVVIMISYNYTFVLSHAIFI